VVPGRRQINRRSMDRRSKRAPHGERLVLFALACKSFVQLRTERALRSRMRKLMSRKELQRSDVEKFTRSRHKDAGSEWVRREGRYASLRREAFRHAITKQGTTSFLGQPFRTCEMALPDTARADRLAHRINLEDQESCLIPFGALSLSVEKTQVGVQMFCVVACQRA
jgi:hypothetical protein